ncbi:MAG: tyrosine-protein phosphatase [Anaerolineae bacterium]|nr:tyrosine-protein phosphatase [Anaerolineae bacterium]
MIALEGGVNFRDIGGYVTQDGRRIRWGKIYRSGSLAQLTPRDYDIINQLEIRLICDLRSHQEFRAAPEMFSDALYEHLPVEAEDSVIARLYALFFDQRRLTDLLIRAYTKLMIDKNAHVFGLIYLKLADPEYLPALIRCTAGKDRTGIVIAFLLLSLGVSEETVLADYSLSNLYYENFKAFARQALGPLGIFGFSDESLQPLLVADPEILRQTFAYVCTKYGSIDAYLRDHAGVSAQTMAALKENLLETVT